MNVVYELNQPSGHHWGGNTGARLYHRQRPAPASPPRVQLSELSELEAQMTHYEDEYGKLIERIRTLYVIQDVASVFDFLRRHRQIPQVLADAEPHLRQCFRDSVFLLSTVSDEQAWEMLYVLIQWAGDPDDALQALNRFDDAWWLVNSYPAGSSLTFTYRLL